VPDLVPEWDLAARAAWVARLRAARATLGESSKALARARRYDDVVTVEANLARLGRLIDQVESAGYDGGRWLRADRANAPAALAPLDRAVTESAAELALTAQALTVDQADARLSAFDGLVLEFDAAWAARQAALAADEAPVLSPATLADVALGGHLAVEGRDYVVAGRTRWRRGDASVTLADPGLVLELWQDLAGGLALFEGQPLAADAADQARLVVDGAEFRLRWRDDGGGAATDAGGRSWRAGPRWLYASEDGVMLWLELVAGVYRASRGLPLAADDFHWP
jgi:hypothetical protein